MFEHPYKQYALFNDLEDKVTSREVAGIPEELKNSPHPAAYYGVLKMVVESLQPDSNSDSFIVLSHEIDSIVTNAVAEHSLNPQNIEAEIRKNLLPILFKTIGLDNAKIVSESIISITRNGLSG